MKPNPALLAMALALALTASMNADARGTARFGNKLVSTGDSVGHVIQVAGKPDRTVTLENRFGAAAGERWDYYRSDGTTVMIEIHDGRVTDVDEVR